MGRLLPVVLVALLAGCLGAGERVAPQADAPAADREDIRDDLQAPATEVEEGFTVGAAPKVHLEGRFYARAMLPGVCERELTTGCSTYAHEVEDVTFDLSLNRSQMANMTFGAWIFNAMWTPTQAAATSIYLHVIDETAQTTVAKARGESPLSIQVPRGQLDGFGKYRLRVAPIETGALYDQAVVVTLGVQ